MKKIAGICSLILVTAATAALAQDGTFMPPKVLMTQREFIKPGREGVHSKSEAKFARAMAASKIQTHYIAASSLSGRPRVVYLFGFPSFAQLEKEFAAFEASGVEEAQTSAMLADGDMTTEFSQGIFTLNSDMNLRPRDWIHERYFEITQFHIKPGKRAQFMELGKLYRDALEKASTTANWAVYESQYGEDNGGYYLIISTDKSLAEDDTADQDNEKMMKILGADGMKKVRELTADAVQSESTNLFIMSPNMSYPDESWIKADPFWKPKAAAQKPVSPAQ